MLLEIQIWNNVAEVCWEDGLSVSVLWCGSCNKVRFCKHGESVAE
jgi:hypothetical protein